MPERIEPNRYIYYGTFHDAKGDMYHCVKAIGRHPVDPQAQKLWTLGTGRTRDDAFAEARVTYRKAYTSLAS